MATAKQRTLKLARLAEQFYDEHGSATGDYYTTEALDFVAPKRAEQAPFCDMGGKGLGLIFVHRKRVYARSYKFGPHRSKSVYLVGRNEAGTYFSHCVASNCSTVLSAIRWIWKDRAEDIIQRQGDIALIKGRGPKFPELPNGHLADFDRELIFHDTHPALRFPGKNERIIVGRRAHAFVSEESRD